MTVYLKFFAGLRDHLPAGERPYPARVDEGATVRRVLGAFHVPPDKPAILLVNGRHTELDHVLLDGDLLAVFPPIAGG